ncbi:MAG TPA: phosphodiester glycosidase family protein [Anaerolineales bacterium]|nr:phosphodiester glycosidase family protein [Anaerolineales bacterium]
MKSRPVRVITSILILLLLLVAGYSRYTRDRPSPVPIKKELYPGVIYRRSIRVVPRPMVIHAVMVDTKAKNISFLVTPPDSQGDRPLKARTTSQFLTEFHVQLAINGDRFFPWWSRSPADYYPHVGDPITPFGFSASKGQVYWNGEMGPDGAKPPTLYISRRNTLSVNNRPDHVYSAISGERMLVEKGQRISTLDDKELAPRTALGLNRNGRYLYIIVVDGRQPFYSEGCTFRELAEILQAQGAYFAMAMDGGGSSTLVVEGEDGASRIMNSPIDSYIPGRERPVGNHLGIIVNP